MAEQHVGDLLLQAYSGLIGFWYSQLAYYYPWKAKPRKKVFAATCQYHFSLDPTECVVHNLFPRMKCVTNAVFNHLVKWDENYLSPGAKEQLKGNAKSNCLMSPAVLAALGSSCLFGF